MMHTMSGETQLSLQKISRPAESVNNDYMISQSVHIAYYVLRYQ